MSRAHGGGSSAVGYSGCEDYGVAAESAAIAEDVMGEGRGEGEEGEGEDGECDEGGDGGEGGGGDDGS